MAATAEALKAELPVGVLARDLQTHPDDRGTFTEIFREEWGTGVRPIQWNCVSSLAGTLRGVHVHARHDDYLIVLRGLASIALRDLRQDSPTCRRTVVVDLDGERLRAITIPTGVAHGFYFRRNSAHVYTVSHYWDTADEMGCRWDDPALELPWRIPEPPRLSPPRHLGGQPQHDDQRVRAQASGTRRLRRRDTTAVTCRAPGSESTRERSRQVFVARMRTSSASTRASSAWT